MDYFLTEEQKMIQDLARQIAEEKVLPLRAELDEKEEFSHEILKHFADSDLLGLNIPEEYGGMGMGTFEQVLATEQVARICCGTAVTFGSGGLGATPILLYGSEEQKKQYLPDIASGKKLTAFALTESTAGSDVSGIQTTAVRDGDEY
ncbi:MAG: acyl-CoA dehydrogenase family protein, partial [Deltaproteobacteria bacterium]|nr:acyl-CoA dehydrogenase family protein [Deltaproteobacteria bacterium]